MAEFRQTYDHVKSLLQRYQFKSHKDAFDRILRTPNQKLDIGDGMILTINFSLNCMVVYTKEGRKIGPFLPDKDCHLFGGGGQSIRSTRDLEDSGGKNGDHAVCELDDTNDQTLDDDVILDILNKAAICRGLQNKVENNNRFVLTLTGKQEFLKILHNRPYHNNGITVGAGGMSFKTCYLITTPSEQFYTCAYPDCCGRSTETVHGVMICGNHDSQISPFDYNRGLARLVNVLVPMIIYRKVNGGDSADFSNKFQYIKFLLFLYSLGGRGCTLDMDGIKLNVHMTNCYKLCITNLNKKNTSKYACLYAFCVCTVKGKVQYCERHSVLFRMGTFRIDLSIFDKLIKYGEIGDSSEADIDIDDSIVVFNEMCVRRSITETQLLSCWMSGVQVGQGQLGFQF